MVYLSIYLNLDRWLCLRGCISLVLLSYFLDFSTSPIFPKYPYDTMTFWGRYSFGGFPNPKLPTKGILVCWHTHTTSMHHPATPKNRSHVVKIRYTFMQLRLITFETKNDFETHHFRVPTILICLACFSCFEFPLFWFVKPVCFVCKIMCFFNC